MNFDALIVYFETLHPAFFVIGLALLPLGPVPVSALWILAGMRFGPPAALLISAFCLFINLTLAYILSNKIFESQIGRFMDRWNKVIPHVAKEDQFNFSLLIRILPGNPLFVQNYLLGLVGIPFSLYIGFGLLIQMLYAAGFIYFGNFLFEGSFGGILFGVLILFALILASKIFSKHISKLEVMKRLIQKLGK